MSTQHEAERATEKTKNSQYILLCEQDQLNEDFCRLSLIDISLNRLRTEPTLNILESFRLIRNSRFDLLTHNFEILKEQLEEG